MTLTCITPPSIGSISSTIPTDALKAFAAIPVVSECAPVGSKTVRFVSVSSPLTLRYSTPMVISAYPGMTKVVLT